MRRISSATLELPEDTLVILSFHFLFMRKPTPACPLLASEWYSTAGGHFGELRNFPLFFGLLRALSRPISCCFLSVHLPVLARVHIIVMFLHCMLQSSVALPLCGGSSSPLYHVQRCVRALPLLVVPLRRLATTHVW